jgi:hypothetical protein
LYSIAMIRLLTHSVLLTTIAASALVVPCCSYAQAHGIRIDPFCRECQGDSKEPGCSSCQGSASSANPGQGARGSTAPGLTGKGGAGPLQAIGKATQFALPLLALASAGGAKQGNSGTSPAKPPQGSTSSNTTSTATTRSPAADGSPLSFGPAAGDSTSPLKR